MAMRHALLLFLLAPASCAAQFSLSGTEWQETDISGEKAIECPDAIRFEAAGYIYYNDFFAPGQDGVVETGNYEIVAGSLWLRNRQIPSVGSRLETSADPLELVVTSTHKSRLVLAVDGKRIYFKRR